MVGALGVSTSKSTRVSERTSVPISYNFDFDDCNDLDTEFCPEFCFKFNVNQMHV
jgi:hypothetical protein